MSRKQRRVEQQKHRPSATAVVSSEKAASGGPRTPEGKAVSSQNAFSHGLTSALLVLPWEDQNEFDSLLSQLAAEHQPVTATEGILVREMAEQYWRLQRARNHEYALLVQTPEIVEQAQTNMALHDAWDKQVTLAQRYVTRHERAFHKCLATLRMLQKERRAAESEAAVEAETETKVPVLNTLPSPEFVSQNSGTPNVAKASAAASHSEFSVSDTALLA